MSDKRFISVILPLKLEWEPYYCVPEHLSEGNNEKAADLSIGDRVKVMFAHKEYLGVVSGTGIIPEVAPEKVLPIISIERNMEHILPQEIELWRAVSNYYLCSIGEVYRAAYPIGKSNLEEAKALSKQKSKERQEKRIREFKDKLQRTIERSEKRLANLKEDLKKARKEERIASITETIMQTEEKITLSKLKYNNPDTDLSESEETPISAASVLPPVNLTSAQQEAVRNIKETFSRNKPVLLHGVTGSGKTEIYIKLAQETVCSGKNVLYLVPEIALSRQLEERLRSYFPDNLLVFHSAESAASKRDTAEVIRSYINGRSGNKKGYIVLGTRSSLFLPHNDLGLIIVDEEHDNSYKQDSPAPRYHGRDTALMLHRVHNCRIILGSATPSLESLHNCNTGKYGLVYLSERYNQSDVTDIEIIDTKAERRKNGIIGNFSRKLIAHMEETLKRKEQIVILRSRRSWATALQCTCCGEIQKCPHCNVSLNLHKTPHGDQLICHYCGHTLPYSGKCSKCGGDLISSGAGTQRIEEEVAKLFPNARTARLDSDTAQNKTYETKTIKDFSNGEIDILIGTQILTKGFDFSGLTLVAVIAADTLLGIQDFRADEKAVQLLEQFRGRCGRRNRKGLFVIQTSQPEHPIYKRICSGHINEFTSDLLNERRLFNFPPFTRIVEINISDKFEDRLARMSDKLAYILGNCLSEHGKIPITGPYAPAVDKVADRYVRTIRVSFRKDRKTADEKLKMKAIVGAFEKEHKYQGHISINVDPS